MNPAWLRLAYAFEFLLALIAVFTAWSQIGGQGHLDLMQAYWKGLLGVGMAYTIVRMTDAAVGREKAWNVYTVAWLLATLLIAVGMAMATYYAHMHENDDEDSTDGNTVTSSLQATQVPALHLPGLIFPEHG
jgi:hypothetical protein